MTNVLASSKYNWVIRAFISVSSSVFLVGMINGQTVTTNDVINDICRIKLNYEIYGTGSPILFLHGFGASSYSWRYLVEPLSKNHQLILVDLKGFGKSPKPADDGYGIEDQAELIYQFILDHDLHGLTMIGHSMGGGVALVTATMLSARQPKRLSKLVLIDSAGLKQKLPFFIKILRTPFIGSLIVAIIPNKTKVRLILKKAYFDDGKINSEQIRAYAQPLGSPGGNRALVVTAKEIIPKNVDEITRKYKNILVPTLILWGSNDEIVPLEVGKKLRDIIPNAILVEIDRCGHVPHEEMPGESAKVISEFLK